MKKLLIKRNEAGITLIALISTVIIMLILAGVSISGLTSDGGMLDSISDIKVKTQSEQLKEAIYVYTLNNEFENKREIFEKYPIKVNDSGEYMTLDTVLPDSEKNNLPDDLKYILLSLSMNPSSTLIPTFDMIDYTKFYKLDTTNFNVPEEWRDSLYICFNNGKYKIINIDGVKYQRNTIYILVPLNNEADPQYIPIGNNTYKLYGDGTLKVLGELNNNSGITNEESAYINGWNKLNLSEINSKFENRMALDIDGNAKKIYFSCDTIYVIDQNNDLWAWGDNTSNKLGLNHSFLLSEPTKIYSNVKNVWAGKINTYLVTVDNKIFGAGSNISGALGQGNTNSYNSFVEILLNGVTGADIEEIYPSLLSYVNSVIIKCNENVGKIAFGAGYNLYGELGLGNTKNYTIFTQLSEEFNEISSDKISFNGQTTFLLKDNGELYGCGSNTYGQLGINSLANKTSFVYITSNIADVKNNTSSCSAIKNELGEVLIAGGTNGVYNNTFVKLSNFESDINCRILGNNIIISNGKAYSIDYTGMKVSTLFNRKQVVSFEYFPLTSAFITEDGIYTNLENITDPGCKANYSLRKVMENVIYVSGKSDLINVADRDGNIYGNRFIKDSSLNNIRKISVGAEFNTVYALTNDGHLFAKGTGATGLWGDTIGRSEFQHITSNGNDYIDNIKDIFSTPSSFGICYTTEDGKLYWGGSRWKIILPNISGDLSSGESENVVTAYPKEVNSPVLDVISKDIIDVERSQDNNSTNTFILTNTGELYVMSSNANTSGLGKTVTNDFEKLVIKEGVKVKQVVASDALCLALLENGEVYGWGYNSYGILGNGYELNGIYPTPQKLYINNIDSISLGSGFAIFSTRTGEIYGIGRNEYGQLGTGDTISRNEFVRCPMLEE